MFDAAVSTMTARTAVAREEISAYVNDEKRKASVAFLEFLETQPIDPRTIHVMPEHGAVTAAAIATLAAQISADLIVVGTRGRNGARKLFLGSVAEKIIGESECDTLAVPPLRAEQLIPQQSPLPSPDSFSPGEGDAATGRGLANDDSSIVYHALPPLPVALAPSK